MNGVRTALSYLLTLFLAGGHQSSAPTEQKNADHPMVLSEATNFQGELIVFEGGVGPKSFFDNLERLDTPQGIKFQRQSGEVKVFPTPMYVRLMVLHPFLQPKKKPNATVHFDPKLMRELKLEGYWKSGFKLRAIKSLTLKTVSESNIPDHGDAWIYELVIEENDVPLTDHLILDVFSKEQRIVRLSAYL
jgi:hypothetical protein